MVRWAEVVRTIAYELQPISPCVCGWAEIASLGIAKSFPRGVWGGYCQRHPLIGHGHSFLAIAALALNMTWSRCVSATDCSRLWGALPAIMTASSSTP